MEYRPSNTITKALQEVYTKELVGQRFVRRSKYGGETFGEIKEVTVHLCLTYDKETSAIFQYNLDRIKSRKRNQDVEPKVFPTPSNPYTAFRPSVIIKSTNNITYELEELFIIQNKEDDTQRIVFSQSAN